MQFDTDYNEWKIGDIIVWQDEPNKNDTARHFKITRINLSWIYWNDPKGGNENMTRNINLLRVKYN